jgi:hypothetical protein
MTAVSQGIEERNQEYFIKGTCAAWEMIRVFECGLRRFLDTDR